MYFLETSAKEAENVERLFMEIAVELMEVSLRNYHLVHSLSLLGNVESENWSVGSKVRTFVLPWPCLYVRIFNVNSLDKSSQILDEHCMSISMRNNEIIKPITQNIIINLANYVGETFSLTGCILLPVFYKERLPHTSYCFYLLCTTTISHIE